MPSADHTSSWRKLVREAILRDAPLAFLLLTAWVKFLYIGQYFDDRVLLEDASEAGRQPLERALSLAVSHPSVAMGTLGVLLLILAPLQLFTRRWYLASLLIMSTALGVLVIADLVYLRFYGDVLSPSSLTQVATMYAILPSIVEEARLTDPFYFADVIVLTAVILVYVKLRGQLFQLSQPVRSDIVKSLANTAVVGVLLIVPLVAEVVRSDSAVFGRSTLRLSVVNRLGLLPYHAIDVLDHLAGPSRVSVEESEKERARRLLVNLRHKSSDQSPLFGVARDQNVILISAESLQAFVIGLLIDGQEVAPNITAFAQESLYFSRYYEQTYFGATSDAEFSVLQSLHPLSSGYIAVSYTENDYRALPEILHERGYQTLVAVAARAEFWSGDRIHPRYGFRRNYTEDDYEMTERINSWLADGPFLSQTTAILDQEPTPFFAFLLTSTNHHPYELPERYRVLRLGHLEGTRLGEYLHTVHYLDTAFGEAVRNWRASGLLDRAVIVLYGDHQGFLHDPVELGDLLGLPGWDKLDRFLVRKRVPFLIRLPHGAYAGERTVAGGHLDVALTVLSLLGIRDDAGVMFGQDLTQGKSSLVVFRDGSFLDGEHVLMRNPKSSSESVCFRLVDHHEIDCGPLEGERREARERLEVSDIIVQGNLIPDLHRALGGSSTGDVQSSQTSPGQ